MVFLGIRCWGDGPAPTVKKIATDTDNENIEIIVKPNRWGTFIMEEVPKEDYRSGPASRRGSTGSSSNTLYRSISSSSSYDSQSQSHGTPYNYNGHEGNPVFKYASRETLAAHENHKKQPQQQSKPLPVVLPPAPPPRNVFAHSLTRTLGKVPETIPIASPRSHSTQTNLGNESNTTTTGAKIESESPKNEIPRFDYGSYLKNKSEGPNTSTSSTNLIRDDNGNDNEKESLTSSLNRILAKPGIGSDSGTNSTYKDPELDTSASRVSWKGSIPNVYSLPPFPKVPRTYPRRTFTVMKDEIKKEKVIERTYWDSRRDANNDSKEKSMPSIASKMESSAGHDGDPSTSTAASTSDVRPKSDVQAENQDVKSRHYNSSKSEEVQNRHYFKPRIIPIRRSPTPPEVVWCSNDDEEPDASINSEEDPLSPTLSYSKGLSNTQSLFPIPTIHYTSPSPRPSWSDTFNYSLSRSSYQQGPTTITTEAQRQRHHSSESSEAEARERKKFCDKLLEKEDVVVKVPAVTSKKSSSPVPGPARAPPDIKSSSSAVDQSLSLSRSTPSLFVAPPKRAAASGTASSPTPTTAPASAPKPPLPSPALVSATKTAPTAATNTKPTPSALSPRISSSSSSAAVNHDDITYFDEEEEFSLQEDEFKSDDGKTLNKESCFENYYKSITVTSSSNNNVKGLTSCSASAAGETANSSDKRIVGVDIGSTWVKFCVLNGTVTTSGNRFKDKCRSLLTSDGKAFGNYTILHAMSSPKANLIYKWKVQQSKEPEPVSPDVCELVFKVFLAHCSKEVLKSSTNPNDQVHNQHGRGSEASAAAVFKHTHWNISCIPSVQGVMNLKVLREIAYSMNLLDPATDELRLVNESTAAAITAYQFLKEKLKDNLLQGVRFLSINVGAAFVHISSYEIQAQRHVNDELMALARPLNMEIKGPETQFLELLATIFTKSFTVQYKNRFNAAWIRMLIDFDQMLIAFFNDPESDKPSLFMPVSFYMEFEKCMGKQVSEVLHNNLEEGLVWDDNGALFFNKQLLIDWTQPIIDCIIQNIESTTTYNQIVLSGGGSQLVSRQLHDLFPRSMHHIPSPEYAVVNGLVDIDTVNISFRSPCHIGITGVSSSKGRFSQSISTINILRGLITKGQLLRVGKTVSKQTFIADNGFSHVSVTPAYIFTLLKSYDDEEPTTTFTAKNLYKCSEFQVETGQLGNDKIVEVVASCVGEYQLEVKTVAKKSGTVLATVTVDLI